MSENEKPSGRPTSAPKPKPAPTKPVPQQQVETNQPPNPIHTTSIESDAGSKKSG